MNHREPSLPGDFAIWVFIFAELATFGILFITYAFARAYHVEMFNTGQTSLVKSYGAINTLVLITSSYFVVQAVSAIKENLTHQGVRWLSLALLMGLFFVVIKLIEYHEKLSVGLGLETNLFFMFYFFMTFFHFMHVLLGMIILAALLFKTQRGGYGANNYIGLETGASYWHMVDLVWIILFPLVYVMR